MPGCAGRPAGPPAPSARAPFASREGDSPPPGEPLLLWPSAPTADRWSPVAAVRLPTGDLVVAEKAQNRLFLLRGRDSAPYRLPPPPESPVEWTALALAPGLSFYALDGPGGKIHQYDFHGNYLGEALDLKVAAARFELGPIDPVGLAVDRSGRTVVTDRLGDRVLLFGPGWSYLGTAGETGSAPGAWRRPGRAAVSDDGRFLVADEGNRRVVLLDGVGAVLEVLDTDDPPRGVVALGSGGFAISLGDRVEILDRGLALRESRVVGPGPECRGGSAYATEALAATADGVVVGEGCSGRLLEIGLRGD